MLSAAWQLAISAKKGFDQISSAGTILQNVKGAWDSHKALSHYTIALLLEEQICKLSNAP